MSSNPLLAMLAKQKAQANANDVPATQHAVPRTTAEPPAAGADPDSAEPAKLEAAKAPAQAASTTGLTGLAAAFKPAAPATNAGSSESTGSDSQVAASQDGEPRATLAAGLSGLKLSPSADSRNVGSVPVSLDELLASEDPGVVATEETQPIQFDDLVACQAPNRDLTDVSVEVKSFVEQLDQMYSTLYDADLFAQQVRFIMQELQDNAEYSKQIMPMDVHVMIRGMREKMGMAQIKKEAATAKKTGSTDKKGRATKASQLDSALDSLGGDWN